jgi:hypothetical protein
MFVNVFYWVLFCFLLEKVTHREMKIILSVLCFELFINVY